MQNELKIEQIPHGKRLYTDTMAIDVLKDTVEVNDICGSWAVFNREEFDKAVLAYMVMFMGTGSFQPVEEEFEEKDQKRPKLRLVK
jgi:hypothetical protein